MKNTNLISELKNLEVDFTGLRMVLTSPLLCHVQLLFDHWLCM